MTQRPTDSTASLIPPRLRTAILCGAVPLLIGTAIYAAWRTTEAGELIAAGLLTILLGTIIFLVGIGYLLSYLSSEYRAGTTNRSRLLLQGFFAGGLLLSNLPTASYFVHSACDILTRYTVCIINDSDETIESFVVIGPGVDLDLGPIVPGRNTERHLKFKGDGTLDFFGRHREIPFKGRLDGYVTGGLSGRRTVRFTSRGVYDIDPSDEGQVNCRQSGSSFSS